MTSNDDVLSAIEKTLLTSPDSYPYLKPLHKPFWLLLVFTAGNRKTYLPGNQSEDWLYV